MTAQCNWFLNFVLGIYQLSLADYISLYVYILTNKSLVKVTITIISRREHITFLSNTSLKYLISFRRILNSNKNNKH